MPNIKMYYEIEIKDAKGHLLKRSRKKLCHSYVKAFIQLLSLKFSGITINVLDITNTSRTCYSDGITFLQATGAASQNTQSIVLGTGTTAPLIGDYKMQTIIAHGSAATQLLHGAPYVGAAAVNETTANFIITRTFVNSSGGTITPREIGLYVLSTYSGGASANFMIEHSAANFSIVNGASATITYTIACTV